MNDITFNVPIRIVIALQQLLCPVEADGATIIVRVHNIIHKKIQTCTYNIIVKRTYCAS